MQWPAHILVKNSQTQCIKHIMVKWQTNKQNPNTHHRPNTSTDKHDGFCKIYTSRIPQREVMAQYLPQSGDPRPLLSILQNKQNHDLHKNKRSNVICHLTSEMDLDAAQRKAITKAFTTIYFDAGLYALYGYERPPPWKAQKPDPTHASSAALASQASRQTWDTPAHN